MYSLLYLLYFLSAFATRLFSVLRFESVIHEFDPYFNYRTTKYLAENGFYSFHNWFDDRVWYPLGRIIGGINCMLISFHTDPNNTHKDICKTFFKYMQK